MLVFLAGWASSGKALLPCGALLDEDLLGLPTFDYHCFAPHDDNDDDHSDDDGDGDDDCGGAAAAGNVGTFEGDDDKLSNSFAVAGYHI